MLGVRLPRMWLSSTPGRGRSLAFATALTLVCGTRAGRCRRRGVDIFGYIRRVLRRKPWIFRQLTRTSVLPPRTFSRLSNPAGAADGREAIELYIEVKAVAAAL